MKKGYRGPSSKKNESSLRAGCGSNLKIGGGSGAVGIQSLGRQRTWGGPRNYGAPAPDILEAGRPRITPISRT